MINSQWMFKLPIHQWIASINLKYWLIFSKTRRNHLKRSHFLIAKHSRRPPFWRTTRICYVRQPLTDLTHVAFTFYISFYSFHKRDVVFLAFRNKRMRERDREKHRHRSRSRSRSPSRKRRSRSRSRSPRRKHDRPSSPVASKSKSSKEKKSIPDNNDKELKR